MPYFKANSIGDLRNVRNVKVAVHIKLDADIVEYSSSGQANPTQLRIRRRSTLSFGRLWKEIGRFALVAQTCKQWQRRATEEGWTRSSWNGRQRTGGIYTINGSEYLELKGTVVTKLPEAPLDRPGCL